MDKISITNTVAMEFGKTLPDWVNIVPNPEAKALSRFLDLGEATSIVLTSKHKNSLLMKTKEEKSQRKGKYESPVPFRGYGPGGDFTQNCSFEKAHFSH